MKRLAAGLAALLFAATAAFATGTATEKTEGASFQVRYYDLSGTGAGPYVPAVTLIDKDGVPVTSLGSGGSGGTASTFDAAFPTTGTAAGLSDGTNMKAWLAAIALGDGVNGNNTAAVAGWLWNGTTYDRARGDVTNGAWVNVKTSVLPTGAATAANQTSVIGTKAPGTAAASSTLVGCVYTAAGVTLTDGQQAAEQCDINGRRITSVASVTGGAVASGATDSGNPLKVGCKYNSTAPTFTDGQRADCQSNESGAIKVDAVGNTANLIKGSTAAMTGTTSTSVIAAPGAGLRNYITQCTVTNSHATVGTLVTLQDGSGGTTQYQVYAAPAGGGGALTFPAPLRQDTANTALYAVNGTTGANVYVSCSGYKGA